MPTHEHSPPPGTFATPPMLGVPEKVLANLQQSVPFPKRLGDPKEFGSLVLELVRNSYFNGQNLRLDGTIRMPPREPVTTPRSGCSRVDRAGQHPALGVGHRTNAVNGFDRIDEARLPAPA